MKHSFRDPGQCQHFKLTYERRKGERVEYTSMNINHNFLMLDKEYINPCIQRARGNPCRIHTESHAEVHGDQITENP